MESGRPGQTRGRILLIDDDPALGAYLARILRTRGPFEVDHELLPKPVAGGTLLAHRAAKDATLSRGARGGEADCRQDHRNVHRAAMAAARKIGQVYCHQSPSATIDFRPAHFVPIDRHIGVKLSTIDIFGSQVAVRDYLEPAVIESTARYWVRFCSGSHAEASAVVRHRGSSPARPPGERPAVGSRAGRR
jgi:hypothetical protein